MSDDGLWEPNPKLAAVVRNLAMESIAERVRMRALLELLEEKEILLPGEFDVKAEQVWERDFGELSADLWQKGEARREEVEAEKDICVQCGALCCKYVSVTLLPGETELLARKAEELGIGRLEMISEEGRPPAVSEPRRVLYASPCPFLDERDLCRIYDERPKHCQGYPYQWQNWCALSRKWYGFESSDLAQGSQGL